LLKEDVPVEMYSMPDKNHYRHDRDSGDHPHNPTLALQLMSPVPQ
jgi:hypothetical protein